MAWHVLLKGATWHQDLEEMLGNQEGLVGRWRSELRDWFCPGLSQIIAMESLLEGLLGKCMGCYKMLRILLMEKLRELERMIRS